MKKLLNATRCRICLGEFRSYRPVIDSSGDVAEACWDCYQKEKGKTNYQPGWVYVIGHGDFWKVGKTQGKPESRLKELQVGNPHCLQIFDCWLVRDCSIAERFAHASIREYHHRGEWFRGDPREMVELIKNWNLGGRS